MKRRLLFFLAGLVLAALVAVFGPALTAQDPPPGDEEQLETFVPSEKVKADSDISFPVDI
jgi:hypothetical protein